MKNSTLKEKITSEINCLTSSNPAFSKLWHSLHSSDDFYLIGGTIRSIYTGRLPRDIDIIVKSSADTILESLDNNILISKNYYGGYKLNCLGLHVDIWDFDNHWAFKQGILDANKHNLAKSCFYDFDALVYSPVSNYLDIDRFTRSYTSGTIDFICNDHRYIESNPGKLTNVLRAFVSAIDFNLSFSASVAAYIKTYLKTHDFNSLKKCEHRHYNEEKLTLNSFKRILHTIG